MIIIAFAGVKQSGKDTACDVVEENFKNTTRLTFAEKLKTVCSKVFDLDMKHFTDNNLKEVLLEDIIFLDEPLIRKVIENFGYVCDYDKHIRGHIGIVLSTPRELLQYVGTEVLHAVDKQIHILSIIDKISNGINIITDLRFEQEIDYFMENYPDIFFPIYIKNDVAENIAKSDLHKSEMDLGNFKKKCMVIENNSSLKEYREQVTSLIGSIL